MKIKVAWDLNDDGKQIDPNDGPDDVVDVPENIAAVDISDWLSDKFGWCVLGWSTILELD